MDYLSFFLKLGGELYAITYLVIHQTKSFRDPAVLYRLFFIHLPIVVLLFVSGFLVSKFYEPKKEKSDELLNQ